MSTNCHLKCTQQHRASWSVSSALRAAVCTSELWPQARGTNRTQHTRAATAGFTAWTNLKITAETIIQVKAAERSRKAHMHSSFKNSDFHFNTNDLIMDLILRISSPSIWSTTSQRATLVTAFLPHPNSSLFWTLSSWIWSEDYFVSPSAQITLKCIILYGMIFQTVF